MSGKYKIGDVVLGSWKLVSELGQGSFGKVFAAERENFGTVYHAAIKIITIPASQSEIKSARAEGMDDQTVTEYFKSCVKEIVNEFHLMSELKGNSNIVSYEDHDVIEHTDGIGWDIIIRMEKLTALTDYLSIKDLERSEILKLGIDLCKALEICRKKKIIHRDIKPENIFVSEFGDFKLGDFGIARTMEKTSGMSHKGTYAYMAPEVYSDKAYNEKADIYSLGIVLYWLLNGKRTPFLPLYPQPIHVQDRDNAVKKRMSGEAIPLPVNAQDSLGEAVLKACAFEQSDRYESAEVFRKVLEKELEKGLGTESENRTEAEQKTEENKTGEKTSETIHDNGDDLLPDHPDDKPADDHTDDSEGTIEVRSPSERNDNDPGTAEVQIPSNNLDDQPPEGPLEIVPAGPLDEPSNNKGVIFKGAIAACVIIGFIFLIMGVTNNKKSGAASTASTPSIPQHQTTVEEETENTGSMMWSPYEVIDDYGTADNNIALDGVSLKSAITDIYFEDTLENASDSSIDISAAGNNSVLCWMDGSSMYIAANGKIIAPENCHLLFDSYSNLKKIHSLELFDTSKVTDMSYMFNECRNLEVLNLTGFETSNVTDMSGMFIDCKSLAKIDLLSFNTSKVVDMSGMFIHCRSVTEFNLSSFNTSNVTSMEGMFYQCDNLPSLNLSNFDTSNVMDMSYMFFVCSSLKTLNLSGFDTSNVTDMQNMFYNCSALTNFNPNWLDTSNANTDCMYDETKWE